MPIARTPGYISFEHAHVALTSDSRSRVHVFFVSEDNPVNGDICCSRITIMRSGHSNKAIETTNYSNEKSCLKAAIDFLNDSVFPWAHYHFHRWCSSTWWDPHNLCAVHAVVISGNKPLFTTASVGYFHSENIPAAFMAVDVNTF